MLGRRLLVLGLLAYTTHATEWVTRPCNDCFDMCSLSCGEGQTCQVASDNSECQVRTVNCGSGSIDGDMACQGTSNLIMFGLAMALFTLVGQGLFVYYHRRKSQARTLLTEGQRVTGTVLKKTVYSDSDSTNYCVEYSFPIGQKWGTKDQKVEHVTYEKLSEQEPVQVVYYVKDPRYVMLVDEAAFKHGTCCLIGGSVFAGTFFAAPVLMLVSAVSNGAGIAMLGPFLAFYLPGSLAQAHAVVRPFAPIPVLSTMCNPCFGPPKDVISSSDPALAAPATSAQVVPAAQQIELRVRS